jgi:hypothetical protein
VTTNMLIGGLRQLVEEAAESLLVAESCRVVEMRNMWLSSLRAKLLSLLPLLAAAGWDARKAVVASAVPVVKSWLSRFRIGTK